MQLSLNFDLNEFLQSNTAYDLGYILAVDDWTLEQLKRLVATVLQPIRRELGESIMITSGYRPPWLNHLIRGSKDSRHMYGLAADWHPVAMPLDIAFQRVKQMNLPIDQLILETLQGKSWIHVGIAFPGTEPRQQYMTAVDKPGGGVTYKNV